VAAVFGVARHQSGVHTTSIGPTAHAM
jgi:hypothetical protein